MTKITLRQTTRVTKEYRLEVFASDLIKLLDNKVPDDAAIEVFVQVPGGGDWSNTDLDIDDKDTPIVLTWTVKEEYDDET